MNKLRAIKDSRGNFRYEVVDEKGNIVETTKRDGKPAGFGTKINYRPFRMA